MPEELDFICQLSLCTYGLWGGGGDKKISVLKIKASVNYIAFIVCTHCTDVWQSVAGNVLVVKELFL